MATEKILNTRIQLKYDTYANWTSNAGKAVVLKKGEVGICAIPSGSSAVNGDETRPQILMKVGDGASTFENLKWVSAIAADVHTWAKKSESDFTTWVKGLVSVDDIDLTDYYKKSEVDTLLGTNSTNDQKYAKEYTDAAIADLDVTDSAVTGQYVSAVSETDGKISVTRADLPTYTLASGSANGTVAFNGADVAVTGLGSAAYTDSKAYDAAGSAAAVLGESGDTADKNTVYGAKAAAAAAAQAAQTAQSTADGKIDLAGVQALNYATKTEAEGYANAKDEAIAAAKKAGDDAAAALESYKTTNNAAVALKADKSALEEEVARAKAAEQANADAITLLTDGVDQEKVDGVRDLIAYVEEHGTEVTGMKEDIAENAEAIAAEAERASDEETRLAGLISKNAEDIASLLGETGSVAKAEDANKLGGVAAADYLKKSEATGYGDILTKTSAATLYQPVGEYASAAQGAKADTAVQPAALNDYYTKTAADAEFMNSTETNSAIDAKITALNLATTYEPIGAETRAKAYADGLAVGYATAAQGTKADSALQSVEVGTGLKVSEKAANKQTIEIDESVVFVFNCGSSSELID